MHTRRRVGDPATPTEGGPRPRGDRQLPHRGPAERGRPHRLVVLSALRFRPRILAAARRRRGEGLLRRRAGGRGGLRGGLPAQHGDRRRPPSATPAAMPFASPISRRASSASSASSTRRRSSAASSRSPACRASRSGCGRPSTTAGPAPRARSAPTTSATAGGADTLRLTTDAPLSYIAHETPFALIKPVTLILGPDEPFEAAVDTASREFLERTRDYWLDWVRSLADPAGVPGRRSSAPPSRSSCATSRRRAPSSPPTPPRSPKAPGTQRTWDYRYCWLRDAFFVIKALNRLGATQTMEEYIHYITNIAVDAERPLRPVYGIVAGRAARGAHRPRPRGLPGHGARCASATRRPSSCSTTPTAA